jgi:rubrerythrin
MIGGKASVMAELSDSGQTLENLRRAFAEESQAHRLYLHFAKLADQEGLAGVASLFAQTAELRGGQALRLLPHFEAHGAPVTGGSLSDSRSNLEAAAKAQEASAERYQAMEKSALDEGLNEIAAEFSALAKSEKILAARLRRALEALPAGT